MFFANSFGLSFLFSFIYSDILVMYDLSLSCFFLVNLERVIASKNYKIINRKELRNGKKCEIVYAEFPLEFVSVVDLESNKIYKINI